MKKALSICIFCVILFMGFWSVWNILSLKEESKELESEKLSATQNCSKDSEIINILKEIDMNKMSPMVAFDTLAHLVEITKNK